MLEQESAPRYNMWTNFQEKQTTFTFFTQICPKMYLRSEIQNTNIGIRISIVKMPCVQFSGKTNNFDFLESTSLRYYVHQFSDKRDKLEFLGPNLPKNGFWGRNSKNLSLHSESASFRYYVYQFLNKMDNFEFLCLNLPKNEFWGLNLKILSLDLESTPPIYHVRQFSVRMDNF